MINAYYYPNPAELRKNQGRRVAFRPPVVDQIEIGGEILDRMRDDNPSVLNLLLEPPDDVASALIDEETSRFTQPFDEPFLWNTRDGESLAPEDMATMHLFYALRMLFNNTVAPVFRIGKFRRYPDVAQWPTDYLDRAANELTQELLNREEDMDLPVTDAKDGSTIGEQFEDLQRNAEVIHRLGLYV